MDFAMVIVSNAAGGYSRPLGLHASGTQFLLGDTPVRGIGINHFSLALRETYDFGILNTGLDADLKAISCYGFKFVRAAFGWYDHTTWLNQYKKNKSAFYDSLDRVIDKCEQYGIGLIANLCWGVRGFTDMTYDVYGVTDGPSKLAYKDSNAYAMMEAYIAEFVGRYKNRPAIWAWEFGNEESSSIGNEFYATWKLDGTGTDGSGIALPGVCNWGTKPDGASYAVTDKMSQAEYARYTAYVNELFAKYDPHARIVISGNAMGNSFAVNARNHNSLMSDAFSQWDGCPDTEYLPWSVYRDRAYPVICQHIYPVAAKAGDNQFFSDGDLTYTQHIAYAKAWADRVGKPMILEEWGTTQYGSSADPMSVNATTEAENFYEALDAIVANNIQLSCLWNWDGNVKSSIEWQKWSLTDPSRSYQLASAAQVNAEMQ
jgi:hypothetical protein